MKHLRKFNESVPARVLPVPPVKVTLHINKRLVARILKYAGFLDMDDITLEMKQKFVTQFIEHYITDRAIDDFEEKLIDAFAGEGNDFVDDWKESMQEIYDNLKP
jgi:hypothetical protein